MIDASTFAQRFEFVRTVYQRMMNTWQDDVALASKAGMASSRITEYKDRDEPPPSKRTLALARAMGVDPGWLAFGANSAAPAPEGFDAWLARRQPSKHPPVRVIPDELMIPVPHSSQSAKKGKRRAR